MYAVNLDQKKGSHADIRDRGWLKLCGRDRAEVVSLEQGGVSDKAMPPFLQALSRQPVALDWYLETGGDAT